jgi:hypothetical protein
MFRIWLTCAFNIVDRRSRMAAPEATKEYRRFRTVCMFTVAFRAGDLVLVLAAHFVQLLSVV